MQKQQIGKRKMPLYFDLYENYLNNYENTKVKTLEDNTITTEQGNTVTASKIVFACHYPFINIPGYYFMVKRMIDVSLKEYIKAFFMINFKQLINLR